MKYFLMSFRFNKQSPQDFGLIWKDGRFIREDDATEWKMYQLYDFGWGQENGFYRLPLGTFEELIQLVLCDDDSEDSYGAAAMIQNEYPMALKAYLLNLMDRKISFKERKKLKKLSDLFQLHKGLNLTCTVGVSVSEIEKEYDDWKRIAQFFSTI